MKNTKVDIKKMGILIAILIFVIVVISIVVAGGKDKSKENQNNSETQPTVIEGKKLTETKKYKGLEISNVKFRIKEDGMTQLTADVANNTGSDTEGQYINIYVLDENGKRITDFGGFIDPIATGSSTTIIADFLTNGMEARAYDIEITETREEEPDTNNESSEDEGNMQNNENVENNTAE